MGNYLEEKRDPRPGEMLGHESAAAQPWTEENLEAHARDVDRFESEMLERNGLKITFLEGEDDAPVIEITTTFEPDAKGLRVWLNDHLLH